MPSVGFDLQYDHFSRTCTNYNGYRGLGINYSVNNGQKEFGLKAMFNPTRLSWGVTRSLRFYPYLFAQGNYTRAKRQDPVTNENTTYNYFNFRPGLGIAGRYSPGKRIVLRNSLQLGYDTAVKKAQNPWVVEVKIGIGLNMRKKWVTREEPPF